MRRTTRSRIPGGHGLRGVLCGASVPIAGQAPAPAKPTKSTAASNVPRTPDGRPDLSGDYLTATITTLERPEAFGNKLMLTEKEAAELEKQSLERNQARNTASRANRTAPPVGGNVGGYNNFWIDRERGTDVIMVDGQLRTSLIVDPPNGRIPPVTDAAQKRAASRRGVARPTSDAPEEVSTTARARSTTSNSGRSASAASSGSARPRARRPSRCSTTTTRRSCRRRRTS